MVPGCAVGKQRKVRVVSKGQSGRRLRWAGQVRGPGPLTCCGEPLHTTLESDMVQTHSSEVHTEHKCVCGTIR